MTITEAAPTTTPTIDSVTFDLYRDVHKAIRVELFAVTTEAGRLDPSDRAARDALAGHVRSVVDWLADHARHEDTTIDPELRRLMPDLAEAVWHDHAEFDARCEAMVDLADTAATAIGTDRRRLGHRLYLDLASFTSAYLAHQDLEERVIMPSLEAALGVPHVVEMHQAILASLSPAEMGAALALMIPAINLDERVKMLSGIRADAPPEAFDGVCALASMVLAPEDHAALSLRLGLA